MLNRLKIANSDIYEVKSSGLGDTLHKVCGENVKDDLKGFW